MWNSILPLILFVLLGIVILVIFEIRARRENNQTTTSLKDEENSADAKSFPSGEELGEATDDGCCGEHLVCERETLLQTNAEIIYYDDEELDALAGIAAEDYTTEQPKNR